MHFRPHDDKWTTAAKSNSQTVIIQSQGLINHGNILFVHILLLTSSRNKSTLLDCNIRASEVGSILQCL